MNQQSGKKVLFVCLGNICRSPAAEIIFRRFVSDAGLGHAITADSAGTISHHEGSAPDERMADALVRHGFRVEGQARKIKPGDLEDFDLIVTMDEQNHRDVLALDPSGVFHNKVRPFVSFCQDHDDLRVPDPYYGGQRGFNHVVALLRDGCRGILDFLKNG
jgi:protein-tyrosine phosphatase